MHLTIVLQTRSTTCGDIWPMTGDPWLNRDVNGCKQIQADVVAGGRKRSRSPLAGARDTTPALASTSVGQEIGLPLIEQDHAAYMACVSLVARRIFTDSPPARTRGAASPSVYGRLSCVRQGL
jgi:hypothetical protein